MAISFNEIYTDIKTGWNSSWFKFLFQRTLVGQLLNQTQIPNSFDFFQAYLTSWRWIRWWFRDLLQNHAKKYQFDLIVDTAITLRNNNLYNHENLSVVMAHSDLLNLVKVFSILQYSERFTQENFNVIAAYPNPHALVAAFIRLQEIRLFSQENFDVVIRHDHPNDLAEALFKLQEAELLTQENFNAVVVHAQPYGLAEALSRLQEEGLLTSENRRVVIEHTNPYDLADIFTPLQRAGILTQDNFNLVIEHADPYHLAEALAQLQATGLLTQENFNIVATHSHPDNLAEALAQLQEAELLTAENRTAVAKRTNPTDLAQALSKLQKEELLSPENQQIVTMQENSFVFAQALSELQKGELLTPENRTAVAAHADSMSLLTALSYLTTERLLTPENQTVIVAHPRVFQFYFSFHLLQKKGLLSLENVNVTVAHPHPKDLAGILIKLWQARLLTPENRTAAAEHTSPHFFHCVLSDLQKARLLTQDNFNALLLPNHAVLFTKNASDFVWQRIPQHLLTQENYQRLLAAAEHAQPLEELERVTNQIIAFVAGAAVRGGAGAGAGGPAPVLNNTQSTHTASIHRSVSESAKRLMKRYGAGLNLDDSMTIIKTWVLELDNSPMNEAAKRCIECITAPTYTHEDSRSRVSTQQLLALAYIAIHDVRKRIGSLNDAKSVLLEGLYEIQRGYNIERGQGPSEGEDAPICIGGTFNKLMEKLSGIHPDVEVYYITHEGLCFKFPKLVEAHALAHLKSLASPVNTADYQAIKATLDTLEQDGNLSCIWPKIKEALKSELWEEFHEAYSGNQNDARFTSMIEYGGQSAVPALSAIKVQLASSPGYLDWQVQASTSGLPSGLLNYGLWSQRQVSTAHQRTFDLQYGLSLLP